jgi:hypothetical protein
MRNPLSSFALAAAALVAAGSLALAHPPGHQPRKAQPAPQAQPQPGPGAEAPGAPGRNLQVLPADIPQPRLIGIMRSWGQALGVQCSYCHVPGNFASDANPHKNIARGMVRMTSRINAELLPPVVGASEHPRVTCATCHRGTTDTELPPPPEPPIAGGPPPVTPPPPDRRPHDAHIAPDTPARPH